MNRIAVSTSWNARRLETGAEVVDSILDLGIASLELSYNLEPAMARGAIARITETGASVVSIHHPCPMPDGFSKDQASGELYNPASLDETERVLAIKNLLGTLEFAIQTGVRVVVFHAGNIPETRDAEHEMTELFKKGDGDWVVLRDELLRERKRQAPARLDALMRVLDRVIPEYEEAMVGLGIENRYYITDIPSLDEMDRLFDRWPPLLYWHDVGHARARACWGLEGEYDALEEFIGKLAGYHLHDAEGAMDHRAPGKGNIDFAKVFRVGGTNGKAIVLEPGKWVEEEDLREGISLLENILKDENV
ncbi:MAG: sugar phosphate isomerase/epimerase family protein [candidate division WOR-3 bacterium]